MRALVAGAGCCGASAARRLAEYGWQVTGVERREHVGGNAFDRRDEHGMLYHVYGPHVFFTDREQVWEFLRPFVRWTPYRGSVCVWLEQEAHPMPFQPTLLCRLLGADGERTLTALRRRYQGRESATVLELLQDEDPLLRQAGQRLYDCDCAPYNQKQWGLRLEELLPEVAARAPVYLEDRRDFRPERFQFMPEDGFDRMFQRILEHPGIEVRTGVDALELLEVSGGRIVWKSKGQWDAVLYTGRLEPLFAYSAGALPYRTLHFDMEYCTPEQGLPCLAMYYPGLDVPWTRRADYRYLPGNPPEPEKTLVIGERPGPMEGPQDEPYYVVLTEQSQARHQSYWKQLEQVPHLYGAGRLAEFRYYNMDQAVGCGLDIAEEIHRREGRNR